MKRLTLLVCLLLPLAGWAQVNTDLFDTGGYQECQKQIQKAVVDGPHA